jgi:hypothetical protein
MEMRRYIVLLLITGIVWAQTDFDKLILKDGTTYLGEYSTIDGENVLFKPEGAFGFQPITFNTIHKLELANGLKLVTNGKIEQDRLVFKDGTRYLGEFSTIDGENVLFKPEGAFGFQPIPVKQIYRLELKYGHFIIEDGKNSLTLEENQKISNKNLIIISCIIVVVIIAVEVNSFSLNFGSSGGLNCGPPCGGSIDVDYPK